MSLDNPTGREKRRAYLVWFCIALAVDVLWNVMAGRAYQPSLIGLAIMITAVLFFFWSLLTER